MGRDAKFCKIKFASFICLSDTINFLMLERHNCKRKSHRRQIFPSNSTNVQFKEKYRTGPTLEAVWYLKFLPKKLSFSISRKKNFLSLPTLCANRLRIKSEIIAKIGEKKVNQRHNEQRKFRWPGARTITRGRLTGVVAEKYWNRLETIRFSCTALVRPKYNLSFRGLIE